MTIETVRKLMRLAFWASLLFAYVCAVIPGGPEIGHSDKDGHALAFITLALFARLGWSRGRAAWIALALLLFGIFIELSQATPLVHRDADVWDVVADAVGIVAGLVIGSIGLFVFRRQSATADKAGRQTL
ncbi:teicoplanin resistance protein VanZ [Sphingomonas sp.]|uniref:teicoplanin resistance protein VanZ n=1 Tax=Sphingomonas sp. TaxID=28214 RepID=UPI0025D80AD3|nr:teicoplanin resistance protein VanZ [Sphingomonas sp.]